MAPQTNIIDLLKEEYTRYLAAQDRNDIAAVEASMSPSCWQLSRQDPLWNLPDRDSIMSVLASVRKADEASKSTTARGKVEMRALTADEKATLPEEQKKQAAEQGWEGMHVELEDADENGRVVRVNYYWRKEGERWVQCFHDLLFVGPKKEGATSDAADIFGKR